MKATIVEIKHPYQYISPSIKVQIGRGAVRKVDAYNKPHLYNLRVGDQIEVTTQTNNPYLVVL